MAAGVYILLVAFAPLLPDWQLLGLQPVDVKTVLTGTKPGAHGNRLFVPQIGVNVAIAEGNDPSVLNQGAWHRQPQNGNPLAGGNFVLSAHRFVMGWTPQQTRTNSPFYKIDQLKVGDEFFVDYNAARYAYQVTRRYDVPRQPLPVLERRLARTSREPAAATPATERAV